MRSLFIAAIFSSSILFSTGCSKSGDNPVPGIPDAVLKPDTLTTGWTKITTDGTQGTLSDVFFTDASNGYACGEKGVFKSANGGLSWAKMTGASAAFNIGATGTKSGFVGGDSSIYVSTDGSTVQKAARSYTAPAPGFQDIFWSSSSVCYAASSQYIWKSINGGASFDTVYNFRGIAPEINNGIFFINDLTGWLSRSGFIYKTTNGGTSWSLIFSSALTDAVGGIDFLDANNGYFIANRALYKTTNGGATSQVVFPNLGSGNYIDVDFINVSTGFLSFENKIYRTTDGGATWTQVVAAGDPQRFVEIHFTDANHGWACGTYGLLLRFNF